jgi:hypothetical protein
MTVRQTRAQQRNARKSTGPRTAEGKEKSAHNALKHGVFCRHAVLRGESQRTFDVIRQEFIDSLQPQNLVELSLIERIVKNQWKLDRLEEAEGKLYEMRCASHQRILERGLEGELDADDTKVNEWWESKMELEDGSKDPEYQALCSAMGNAAMTMGSLLGDVKGELERYQLMCMRLEQSNHRSFRELRILQADARKKGPLAPSPYSIKQNDALDELVRQLDLPIPDEDEEEDQDEDEDEDEERDAEEEGSSDDAPADNPTRDRGVSSEDQIEQNEPNSEKTTASVVSTESCDDPRAPEPAPDCPEMPENARLPLDVVQQVQRDAETLYMPGEDD